MQDTDRQRAGGGVGGKQRGQRGIWLLRIASRDTEGEEKERGNREARTRRRGGRGGRRKDARANGATQPQRPREGERGTGRQHRCYDGAGHAFCVIADGTLREVGRDCSSTANKPVWGISADSGDSSDAAEEDTALPTLTWPPPPPLGALPGPHDDA